MSNMDQDAVFMERFEQRRHELEWRYLELYRDKKAFTAFAQMLYETYQARSEKLKAWDFKRSFRPGWFRNPGLTAMVLYVNCFNKDLKGLHEKLDYIKESGAGLLHLMPLLESPEGRSDGGYAVSDFGKVQPELGTMEDLYALNEECHKNGISICMDFVMNHTSEDHEWAKKAKQGIKEYQDRYFFFPDRKIPDQFELTCPQVFPITAPGNFTLNEETGMYVMTTFYPYQWDLNYRNPAVLNDMTAAMLNLCNQGVDVIRLDAVPYIWKTMGTNCRNLPEVHHLVRIMRLAAEIVAPGTLLLGEVVMEPDKVAPYFGSPEKPECHLLYNVTTMASLWHTVATEDTKLLKHQLQAVYQLPKQYTFLNYLRCHDDIGWGLDYEWLKQFGTDEIAHKKFLNDYLTGKVWGSQARGELYNDDPRLNDARLCGTTASLCGLESAILQRNPYKIKEALRFDVMLHAFLFTQSGIPSLYSGDEVGRLNDYGYHDDPLKADDSRYLHRGDFEWHKAAMRYDPGTNEGYLYQNIMKLAKIRKEHRAFHADADVQLLETYNDHVLAIRRQYEGEIIIGLFNFSQFEQKAGISEEGYYTDLVTGETAGSIAPVLPPHGFVWMIKGGR